MPKKPPKVPKGVAGFPIGHGPNRNRKAKGWGCLIWVAVPVLGAASSWLAWEAATRFMG